MSKTKKAFLALLLAVFAVFGGDINISSIIPVPEPPNAKILNIQKPTEEVLTRLQVFEDLVTDPDDRAKLAIFNYQFAENVASYSATSQQVNDVYALAGKYFFNNSLVDKYDDLAEEIVSVFTEIVGDKNHTITTEEKNLLQEYFMGIAWVMINKR